MANLKQTHMDKGGQKQGFFSRLFESLAESRMHQAEHELGHYDRELMREFHARSMPSEGDDTDDKQRH
jgi:hypothetical protein